MPVLAALDHERDAHGGPLGSVAQRWQVWFEFGPDSSGENWKSKSKFPACGHTESRDCVYTDTGLWAQCCLNPWLD